MTILFGEGVPELIEELRAPTRRRIFEIVSMLEFQPRMFPIRRRGIMKGYRYFVADGHLVFYSVTSTEVRISAVLPGRMRRA